MSDQERAGRIGREAFDLWEEGKLEDALSLYEQALELAAPSHWATPDLEVECAAVLATMGRASEASTDYQRAIASLIDQGPSPDDPELAVTTYFYADHLVRNDDPESALAAIARARSISPYEDHFLDSGESHALWALGRHDDARSAARRALGETTSAEVADRIKALLKEILDSRP